MAVQVRKIHSNQAVLGMKLAADVFSSTGSLIINRGEELTVAMLHRLRSHGVDYIMIMEGKPDPSPFQNTNPEQLKQFSKAYEDRSEQVESVIHDINSGKRVEQDELFAVTEKVLNSVSEPDDVLKYLYAIKLESSTIFNHSINVSVVCNLVGKWLGFSPEKIKDLTVAALLHDVGKTHSEYKDEKHYRMHPLLGFQLLEGHPFSDTVRAGVLLHHENPDGSGFPTQAKWAEIHEFARVIAIADYYDNKTTGGKSLLEKLNPFKILYLLESERFTRFDINFVNTFMKRIAYYYKDAWVKLNDGRVAKIIFVNDYALHSPIVEVKGQMINLYQEKNLVIEDILD